MRKIIITTASVLILMTVGIGFTIDANADKAESQHSTVSSEVEVQEVTNEVNDESDMEEYAAISNVIHMDDFYADVVEDNKRKRVIIFKDEQNKERYKTIYVKKKERLKVIDFNGGLLFNDVINRSDVASDDFDVVDQADSNELAAFKETSILNEHVDVTHYDVKVVEDNPHKRVIIFQDNQHRPQYKSIYVKDKSYLKIIDLNGGLLYNGTI